MVNGSIEMGDLDPQTIAGETMSGHVHALRQLLNLGYYRAEVTFFWVLEILQLGFYMVQATYDRLLEVVHGGFLMVVTTFQLFWPMVIWVLWHKKVGLLFVSIVMETILLVAELLYSRKEFTPVWLTLLALVFSLLTFALSVYEYKTDATAAGAQRRLNRFEFTYFSYPRSDRVYMPPLDAYGLLSGFLSLGMAIVAFAFSAKRAKFPVGPSFFNIAFLSILMGGRVLKYCYGPRTHLVHYLCPSLPDGHVILIVEEANGHLQTSCVCHRNGLTL